MAYIIQADLKEQLSDVHLIQLTDDPKLGIVDAAIVSKAIASAEAEINGYVAKQASVPLTAPIPELIKKLAIDITVYNLYRRQKRTPDDVRTAYEDAIRKLEHYAKGLITLGIDPPPAPSTQASAGAVFGPARVFDRETLKGF